MIFSEVQTAHVPPRIGTAITARVVSQMGRRYQEVWLFEWFVCFFVFNSFLVFFKGIVHVSRDSCRISQLKTSEKMKYIMFVCR